MKRNLDLLRKILLHIEENDKGDFNWVPDWGKFEDVDELVIAGHIKMLAEAGYIEMEDVSTFDGIEYLPHRVTMSGHDYLDSVRDPKIWKNTKTILSKAGGSTSLAVIQTIAAKLAMQAMGLDT